MDKTATVFQREEKGVWPEMGVWPEKKKKRQYLKETYFICSRNILIERFH